MNEMLGRLVATVMTIPGEWLGVLCDLVEKLASHKGSEWYTELARFLRREPCWVSSAETMAEKVEEVKTYLCRLFTFPLGVTNGKDTSETARKAFRAHFDPDFENRGVVFSGVAPGTEVAADELILDGKFSDFLGSTAAELEKRRLLGSQFLAICRDNPGKLRDGGFANFFVLTKGDEAVAADLSNVFVAYVSVDGRGRLRAYLFRFRGDDVWDGGSRRRVFSPQQ